MAAPSLPAASRAGRALAALARFEPLQIFLGPLVPVALLATVVMGVGVSSEERHIEIYLADLTSAAAAIVSERIHSTFQLIRSYSLRFRFKDAVSQGNVPESQRNLEQLLELEPSIDRAFVTDPKGVLWCDYPEAPDVHGRSFADRDWYRGVSRKWEPYLSIPYERSAAGSPSVVGFAVPFLQGPTVVGILVGQVRTRLLEAQLEPVAPSDTADVLVTSRMGVIVASTRHLYGASQQLLPEGPLRQMILIGGEGMHQGVPFLNKPPVMAVCSPIPRTSWMLTIVEDQAEVLSQIQDVRIRLFLLCGLLYVALVGILQLRRNKALALAAAAEDLRHKNQQLESLVTTVSHDLKSPLVSINGLVTILLDDYESAVDSVGKRYLGMLKQNADRMRGLIDDILRFAKIGPVSLPLDRVDTREVVDRVLAELGPKIEERKIRITVTGDFPVLMTSQTGLYQVLSNLVSNAIKFLGDVRDPAVEVGGVAAGGVYSLRVMDNGVGIDPAYQERIFEPFHRLQDVEAEGSGIGLAIVKRIVETLGGSIHVISQKGQGATFQVDLPVRT
ncbi:MAG: hypothetical protein HY303_13630 [Candidatus Wallbacteria bacterium]|nr:hypothetical protein [Candidatus Wallbacteria bacterium]